MYLLLLKYLYGLPQAAAHFAKHLANSMSKMGFRKVKVDSCLYVRNGIDKKDKVSAGTHVDDILVSATINDLNIFDVDIKKIYLVTSNREGNLSYISLYIMSDRDKNYLVSQKGYRMDVVGKYIADIDKIKEIVRTPAHIN